MSLLSGVPEKQSPRCSDTSVSPHHPSLPSKVEADINVLAAAARNGDLELVQKLWPASDHDDLVIEAAIEGEQLAVVQYLAPPGTKLRYWSVLESLSSSAEIMNYVLSTQDNPDWMRLLLDKVVGDDAAIVEYLLHAHNYTVEEINEAGRHACWDKYRDRARNYDEAVVYLLNSWRHGPPQRKETAC
jgi:hypothetical protein